jgi:hypothetical protein
MTDQHPIFTIILVVTFVLTILQEVRYRLGTDCIIDALMEKIFKRSNQGRSK